METKGYFKIFNRLSFFFVVLFFYSCSNYSKNANQEIKPIPINLDNSQKTAKISSVFKSLSIIKLETTPESIIGEIGKIIITDSAIYISTSNAISIFSYEGAFIKKFNKLGKGPGEYDRISDFLIDSQKNTIEILSAGLQKVLIYDLKSHNYISGYNIGRYAMNFVKSNNGTTLFHCGNDASGNRYDKILCYKNGKPINTYLRIDPQRAKYLHVRRFDFFSFHNDTILFTDVHQDTIYAYDGTTVTPRYCFDIGKKSVPLKLYKQTYSNIAEFKLKYIMGSGYAYGVFNFVESDEVLFFQYNEHRKIKDSDFGEIVPIFVIYDKSTQQSITTLQLLDDLSFTKPMPISVFTSFFSQKDGSIVYTIPSYEIIEMQKNQNLENENIKGVNLSEDMKPLDNPVLFIAKIKN